MALLQHDARDKIAALSSRKELYNINKTTLSFASNVMTVNTTLQVRSSGLRLYASIAYPNTAL